MENDLLTREQIEAEYGVDLTLAVYYPLYREITRQGRLPREVVERHLAQSEDMKARNRARNEANMGLLARSTRISIRDTRADWFGTDYSNE